MASIRPIGASITSIRPHPAPQPTRSTTGTHRPQEVDGAKGARGLFAAARVKHQETVEPGPEASKAPIHGQLTGVAGQAGATAVGAGSDSEPIDLSDVSPRTMVVLNHTAEVMYGAGLDMSLIESTLATIIEPLLAADGVSDPRAAAAELIRAAIAELTSGTESEPEPGPDVSVISGPESVSAGLDLEG